MKYSKELHDRLRNRTGLHGFNHFVGVDSGDIDALLDEIERLNSHIVVMEDTIAELRQSYKYDKTCSTCRYLDENRDCVLGIRCVNYTLWQGKIL